MEPFTSASPMKLNVSPGAGQKGAPRPGEAL
jgi:hypothetical protein